MKSHVGVFVTVDEKKPRLGGVMPAGSADLRCVRSAAFCCQWGTNRRPPTRGLRYSLYPHTQRILRAVLTDAKSLSLVTKVAFRAWARAAAKQSA